MAQSILIFDFGTNEEAVQQARHKVEVWKQAFRLGDKLKLKFERKESAEATGGDGADAEAPAVAKPAEKTKSGGKKAAAKSSASAAKEDAKKEKTEPVGRVRLFVRLAFSDHEKLSYQRWLDRIPTEEPFKSAKGETIRSGDSGFAETSETFDSLE
ncbi:MAG: hypothetical protein ABSE45_11105 [Candidatus Acidiferrales bacterium]|jgi:hypothetical protein